LLVDRGFVPEDRKAPAAHKAGNPAGPQQVEGLLRLQQAGKSSWFVPDNVPAQGEWFSLDIDAMAKAAGITDPLPFTIDADGTPNPGGYPVGGQTPLDLPNNHLQYAITWYLMAVALVVVYLRLVLRRSGSRA
jgi:surfeit locus 1 family protein